MTPAFAPNSQETPDVMPSRRKHIEMTDAELRAYLDAARTIVIVSNGRRGYPHAMPMWFARQEDGAILCTTFAKSQKVLNWRRDAKATLLVESGLEYAQLKGAMMYARCEILEDADAVEDALVAINAKGRSLSVAERAKLRDGVSATAAKRVVLKFTPERVVSWDHAKLGGRY